MKSRMCLAELACISIIIPVYNSKVYLVQCLDSVINQTYSNLQIIIVNDGSTDGSEDIIEEYVKKDERIMVIHQKNQGLSAARNTGMRHVNGKYVLFLDSDDWIDSDTCEQALKAILDSDSEVVLWSYVREYEKTSKPVLILGDRPYQWNEDTISRLYKLFIGLDKEQLRNPQMVDSVVTVWGKLYNVSLLQGINFVDTSKIGTEDALFNIYVFSKVKRACYIPKTFSHYRKTNPHSLTHCYKWKLVYQWQELYYLIRKELVQNQVSDDYFTALNNRIALGIIGLGLSLVEDQTIGLREKIDEMHHILHMKHYEEAINNLPLKYLPIHWKFFFLCAQRRNSFIIIVLLNIMNFLRNSSIN